MTEESLPSFSFMPLTVSMETVGGISTPLVLRGSPLPTKRTDTFSTVEDDQEAVTVRLTMGERPFAKDNLHLARFDLDKIPPQPRGKPQIEVSIEIDRNCRLKVSAIETTSGNHLGVHKDQRDFTIDQNMIQKLLNDAEQFREDDQSALREAELRKEANELVIKAESRLQSMSGTSSAFDKTINKELADLGLAIQGGDLDHIRSASARLEKSLTRTQPHDIFGGVFGDIFTQSPVHSRTKRKKTTGTKRQTDSTSDTSISEKQTQSQSDAIARPSKVPPGLGRIFGGGDFTLDPTLCFVLMPFDKDLQPIYEDHIRQVVEGESLACVRADDIVGTQHITLDIWEHINRSRFLVADLTRQNPNVFYELGLAHAIGKEVILLTQSMEYVPFDLKTLRCLVYEYTPRSMRNLEQKLRRTIRELMNA